MVRTLKIEAKPDYPPPTKKKKTQILELSNKDCKMQISTFFKIQGLLENRMGHLKMVEQI